MTNSNKPGTLADAISEVTMKKSDVMKERAARTNTGAGRSSTLDDAQVLVINGKMLAAYKAHKDALGTTAGKIALHDAYEAIWKEYKGHFAGVKSVSDMDEFIQYVTKHKASVEQNLGWVCPPTSRLIVKPFIPVRIR